jgi:DNA repair protein SbcC/Rad50
MSLKITCVNFRYFTNAEHVIKPGLTLLSGLNGTGKTTVLEAIQYTLYGNMTDQFSNGEKSCSVTLQLEPDIAIQRNSGPGRLMLSVGDSKYEGAYAQQIINNTFGSEAVFSAGTYAIQGERCILLSGTNDEKMEVLRAISFRHDDVEIAYTRISAAMKKVVADMEAAEREFILAQRELENHRKTCPRADFSELDISELNIDELGAEVKQIEGEIRVSRDKLKKVVQLETKIATLASVLGVELVAPSLENEAQLRGKLKDLQVEEKRLNAEIANYDVNVRLREAGEKQQRELSELKEHVQKLEEHYKLTDDTAKTEKERILIARQSGNELKSALAEFGVSTVGELRSKIGETTTHIDQLTTEAKQMQEDVDAKRWNETQTKALQCPNCKTALCFEDHVLKISMSSTELSLKPVSNPNASEASLDELRLRIADLQAKRTKIKDNIGRLSRLASEAKEESENDVQKLEAIHKREELLTKIKALEGTKVTLVEVSGESREVLTATKEALHKEREEITKQLYQFDTLKSQYEANLARIRELEEARKELGKASSEKLEKHIQELNEKLEETKDITNTAIGVIKTVELEAKYTRQSDLLNTLTAEHGNLKKLYAIAKQTEISVLEKCVQGLNDQINELLKVMFPDEHRMTVKYSTTKETRAGKERMTCDISIFYKNAYVKNWKRLSAGEKDRLSLAIMLAINAISDSRFILLDETLNTLDSNSKLVILNMLRAFMGGKKLCIVASHDIVEGTFDNIKMF